MERDKILQGDCIDVLNSLPEKSIDLIFADPPYNLQLQQQLYRPNMTKVDPVNDHWDQFSDFKAYDDFTKTWLNACRRILKDTATIWVIGSYHNIYRVGSIMQNLAFWFLNDIIWIKSNPMPNFRGVRFTNAHETLIWAAKSKTAKYTFNHHAMKSLNDNLQMRSDWTIPICTGRQRIKTNGKKAHSTQKPESLLYRIILASSNPGDIVLDPFFGTGTTGAAAKKLNRHFIGIEKEKSYIEIAEKRINEISPSSDPDIFNTKNKKRTEQRIPFGSLLENNLLQPGQLLYFAKNKSIPAKIKADGNLILKDFEGSIHQSATHLSNGNPCNGWEHWYYESTDGILKKIDDLRNLLRRK